MNDPQLNTSGIPWAAQKHILHISVQHLRLKM